MSHTVGPPMTSEDSDDDEGFLGFPFGQNPSNTKGCFLCEEFSAASDSHVIQSMWTMFWSEFFSRSFKYSAAMLWELWKRDIYDPEVEFNGNRRGLQWHTKEDFLRHIVHPDHMGCDPRIMQRKMIQESMENHLMCKKYVEYLDTDGHPKLDCRVVECRTRISKHIFDLYQKDPKDMIGYSGKAVTDPGQLGGFAKRV